jgi:hypothetical protein
LCKESRRDKQAKKPTKQNIMKIKTIKYIAMSLLIGAALHSSTFAGPATWVQRPTSTATPRPPGITVAFSGHPSKQPYVGVTEIRPTRLFNAGQGVVSLPY